MPKVYIKSGSFAEQEMFLDKGWEITFDLDEADLVCFTGGEDVSPSYYGEEVHPKTFCNVHRDDNEAELFTHCVDASIPMVGICRGGQFLNVMCGGKMFQHVTNHCGNHMINPLNYASILASSTHHQMMRPSEDAIILATSDMKGAKEYMDDDGKVQFWGIGEKDTEVVLYKEQACLCFQPHPELGAAYYDALKGYFFHLLEKHFQLKGDA